MSSVGFGLSPASGKAISELVLHGECRFANLTALRLARFVDTPPDWRAQLGWLRPGRSSMSRPLVARRRHPVKAAVCWEVGKPLVVEDASSIAEDGRGACPDRRHGDLPQRHHLVRGDWTGWTGTPPPVVAGHEAAGIVSDVGPGVTRVRPGDRVVVSLLRTCGACSPCLTGAAYLCEGQFALMTEHRLHAPAGRPINTGIRVAGFAEAGWWISRSSSSCRPTSGSTGVPARLRRHHGRRRRPQHRPLAPAAARSSSARAASA